jgi:VanZ family protein
MTPLHRLRQFLLALCIVTWISAFVATHIPAEQIPQTGMGEGYLHLIGFLGLAGVFWLALAAYGNSASRRIAVVIVVMALYAAADEYTQAYFGRGTSASDWLMDVLGTLCAVALLEIVFGLAKWRRSRRASV